MDILAPRISELLPALISMAVMVIIVGGSIYLVLLYRRSVRAQERIAAAGLAGNGHSTDDSGSE